MILPLNLMNIFIITWKPLFVDRQPEDSVKIRQDPGLQFYVAAGHRMRYTNAIAIVTGETEG